MIVDLDQEFPGGLLRPELFIGVASSISARAVSVNLSEAGHPSGSHYSGKRYGKGEVGEFVLIEGQQSLLLGRIAEVRLQEQERRSIRPGFVGNENLEAVGLIQLLGCVTMDDLRVLAGVDSYPRLGDRIYAAPHKFIALMPQLMAKPSDQYPITLNIGTISGISRNDVLVTPEKLFGRHCAVLGATGGGKSWTTARIIEECIQHKSKLILIDATGEYRGFSGDKVKHYHLGNPLETALDSAECCLPPSSFMESDFIALFEPSVKVQGPKLRAAIRSLRLAKLQPNLASNGIIEKRNRPKSEVYAAEHSAAISVKLDDPSTPFDVGKLAEQIFEECVHPNGWRSGSPDPSIWGAVDEASYSHCLSLITRINGALASPSFKCVFNPPENTYAIDTVIKNFHRSETRLLRICMSGVSYEYKAREVITNTIGRLLLYKARAGRYLQMPVVVLLDEAHNFLGQHVGSEDQVAKLDSFELIAKEGRKYGLNLCLATQRPRDITEGVLSQMGTLVVHRLTNDRDREVVERACGEIDRAASAFLPNLRQGEAAIIGTDFPIPMTVQIHKPTVPPCSEGPDFQSNW